MKSKIVMHAKSVVSDSCDLMNCIPPGFSIHEISQARTLEWGAISSSRALYPPRAGTHVSCMGRCFTVESPGNPPIQ